MTRQEVLDKIAECEHAGAFDTHVDPIPDELVIPVTEDYHYPGRRTLLERIKYRLQKIFIVWPFTYYINKVPFKTRVVGRENLKGLTSAIVTCNHIFKFDCLVLKYGNRGHQTYTVAAPFNNMKGFLGEMMRAGDMLPLANSLHGISHFNRAVERALTEKRQFVVYYPEGSMWWHYKKPRPYKGGAFYTAVKYNVPVVPQFITFEDNDKKIGEGGFPEKHYTLHILPPIYPDITLSRKEDAERMRRLAFEGCRKVYEDTYGIPLSYESDNDSAEFH